MNLDPCRSQDTQPLAATTLPQADVARLRGLRDLPSKYMHHAHAHGKWRPDEIDLTSDARDWNTLTPDQQAIITHVVRVFAVGEHDGAGVLDIHIEQRAAQGRQEEVRILRSLKADEIKHSAFFARFLREVAGVSEIQPERMTASQKRLFEVLLPERFQAWRDRPSAANEVRALVTYHLLSEGMAAVAGIKGLRIALASHDRASFPGLIEGLRRVQIDEARHVAYGLYALHALRLQQPIATLRSIVREIREVAPIAAASTGEIFDHYRPFPFRLSRRQLQGGAALRLGIWLAQIGFGSARSIDRVIPGLDIGT